MTETQTAPPAATPDDDFLPDELQTAPGSTATAAIPAAGSTGTTAPPAAGAAETDSHAEPEPTPEKRDQTALVLFSGGLKSTVALFLALLTFRRVRALTINYGQRMPRDSQAVRRVVSLADVSLSTVAAENVLVGGSPTLQHNTKVWATPEFIPARSLFLLSIAANQAAATDVDVIVAGYCNPGPEFNPELNPEFIDAAQIAASHSIIRPIELLFPFVDNTLPDVIKRARNIPGCWAALAFSHTCPAGLYPPVTQAAENLARAAAFHAAGFPDPLIQRAKSEGELPPGHPDVGIMSVQR